MLALRNLARNKIRTALTFLGVAMGVAVFVSLSSFSTNLKDQVGQLLRQNKIDLVARSASAPTVLTSRISPDIVEGVSELPDVEEVSSVVLGAVRIKLIQYFVLVGISEVEPISSRIGILEGRMFDPDKKEIILGNGRAKTLKRKVGDTITFGRDEAYEVVGIYVTGSQFIDEASMTGLGNARRLLKLPKVVSVLLIRSKPGTKAEQLKETIQTAYPELDAILSGEMPSQVIFFRTIGAVSLGMSLIALIVSIVVVANTLIMAVSERTREIGILMAVGWSRSRIMATIVTESVILCLAAGAMGLLMGWLLLFAIGHSGFTGLDWASGSLTPLLAAEAMAISMAIGVLGSLLPAWLVTRLSPCSALRFE